MGKGTSRRRRLDAVQAVGKRVAARLSGHLRGEADDTSPRAHGAAAGEVRWGLDYLLDQIVPKRNVFDPAEFDEAKRQHDDLSEEQGGYPPRRPRAA